MSELEREIVAVQREMKELAQEAEKFNTPENYAKYGKINRQIVQKDKVLKLLVKEHQQEQDAKAEQKRLQFEQMSEEEKQRKQVEEAQKAKQKIQQQFGNKVQVDQGRAILTAVFLFLFYVTPVVILPYMLPINKSLYKSFANESQLGSFIYGMLGGTIDFRGVSMYFLTFREAYIFSLMISNKLISTLQPINS